MEDTKRKTPLFQSLNSNHLDYFLLDAGRFLPDRFPVRADSCHKFGLRRGM